MRALGGGDEHLASVIRAIVALGRSLNMRVETEMQADFLSRIGCDQLQRFHLGRPLPLDRLPGVILNDFRAVLPGDETGVAPSSSGRRADRRQGFWRLRSKHQKRRRSRREVSNGGSLKGAAWLRIRTSSQGRPEWHAS